MSDIVSGRAGLEQQGVHVKRDEGRCDGRADKSQNEVPNKDDSAKVSEPEPLCSRTHPLASTTKATSSSSTGIQVEAAQENKVEQGDFVHVPTIQT